MLYLVLCVIQLEYKVSICRLTATVKETTAKLQVAV